MKTKTARVEVRIIMLTLNELIERCSRIGQPINRINYKSIADAVIPHAWGMVDFSMHDTPEYDVLQGAENLHSEGSWLDMAVTRAATSQVIHAQTRKGL